MSGCWAVVPVKRLEDAKQRLAVAFSPCARARLTIVMLGAVLSALRETRGLAGIAIVTSERELVPQDMDWIPDPGEGLNGAIGAAAWELERRGATSMLVIPTDVPMVTASEIEALLAIGQSVPIVINPDRAIRGTNALLLTPPRVIDVQFGDESLAKHRAAARLVGQDARVCSFPGLRFDIDLPVDVEHFRNHLDSMSNGRSDSLPSCNPSIATSA